MAEFTRPATWEDVKRLARYLEEEGVEYALIGGYALAAHGPVRLTEDIDLLVTPSAENCRRWIVAFSRLPDGAAREPAAEPDVFAARKSHAVRINDEISVDVLPAAAGVPWEALREFAQEIELEGVRPSRPEPGGPAQDQERHPAEGSNGRRGNPARAGGARPAVVGGPACSRTAGPADRRELQWFHSGSKAPAMLNVTLKKIPKDLHARLRESAERNRRSLNSEILARLESEFSAPVVHAEAHARALRAFVAGLPRADHSKVTRYKRQGRA